MILRPRIPSHASLPHHLRNLHIRQLRRSLQDIERVSHARMPRDVAMVGPDARIVGCELNDQVPVSAEHVHVPPERIGRIGDAVAVPVAVAFGEDELKGTE